ncbi:MAG: hypothetical protein JWP87_2008 [Labilithrix sp.]|nr:hypothetical protein [Labilithrix sp.]
MRSNLAKAALAAIAITGSFAALEGDASACGGCFIPTENPTVVTDHRMILSISKEQSTLYDQIKYSGNPSSFAWVLPISGTVQVGLSADIVFQALDGMTQTTIRPPPQNCPPPPDCGFRNAGTAAPAEAGAAGDGVTVTKREVVGPYETVQLKATDPGALAAWLAKNGFNVPADVQPIVDQYVTEKYDFLALKLVPGKSVQDMRPVRVTTQGASATLPLRMVAAGTGATVGIGLWVLSEGRYEPQNFPSFTIPTDEIAWDWTQNKSNYTEIRAQKTITGGGKAWEIESSLLLNRSNLQNAVENGYYFNPNGGGGGPAPAADPETQAQQAYLPVTDPQTGAVTKTAQQVRTEDLDTLFAGIPTVTTRVTRMRADLAHAALSDDLKMTASADQTELSNFRQLTKEINEPLCPVYNGCNNAGTAPRSEAIARADASNGGGESFACSTSTRSSSPAWLGLGGGFLALALVKAARRRRG